MIPSYYEIEDYLSSLSRSHSRFVDVITVGRSYYGRKIQMIKIGDSKVEKKGKAVFIDGGR